MLHMYVLLGTLPAGIGATSTGRTLLCFMSLLAIDFITFVKY